MKERNARLDCFRGGAILLLIMLHAAMLATPKALEVGAIFNFFERMSIGVPLFYVVSGYIISYSWDGLSSKNNPLMSYFVKRISKIYPLYVLFIMINITVFIIMS
jgi:exopolysaccharide production protein ExoZ